MLSSRACCIFVALLLGIFPVITPGQSRPGSTPSPGGYRFGFDDDAKPTPRAIPGGSKTLVEITLLTPRFGGGLSAQRWTKSLTEMGATVLTRGPVLGDEVVTKETQRGTLRTVHVTGSLEEDGSLVFDGRRFSPDQAAPLAEWIKELAAYGAQGAPDGQPLWGLTRERFNEVYESLSKVVDADLEGLPFSEALKALPLPPGHPLRISTAAESWLADHPPGNIENRLQGFSCGTALALVLNEAGLAVRPLRTPDGNIELAVEPLQQVQLPWPVGWELEDPTNQSELVPSLFQFLEIGFTDASLQDVLDACAAAVEVPIIMDYHGLRERKVDPAQLLVSYPRKKTTWSLMLNTSIRQANLIKEVRTDELARPFVYVTPFVSKPVNSER